MEGLITVKGVEWLIITVNGETNKHGEYSGSQQ